MLNRFHSTHCIVIINAKQLKDEPIVYYINCWLALNLDSKDRRSKSALDMCIQGMHGVALHTTINLLWTFEELTTRAHDPVAITIILPLQLKEKKRKQEKEMVVQKELSHTGDNHIRCSKKLQGKDQRKKKKTSVTSMDENSITYCRSCRKRLPFL